MARLIALAHKNMSARLRQKEPPEDVAQSALKSFYRRRAADGFHLAGDDPWALLVVITLRKCQNRARKYRTASRDLRREQAYDELNDGASTFDREPTPDEAATLSDLVTSLMTDLNDDRERQILTLSLQGFGATEIAAQVGRTRRTVSRILARVRTKLERLNSI